MSEPEKTLTLSPVELRQWRQFAVLAQELHFGRAAHRLNMTQPPLTQSLAQLERTLGVRLLFRTKRIVQLTQAGALLLPQVLDLLQRAAYVVQIGRAAGAGTVGQLKIGFVSTAGYSVLPKWLMAFRQANPDVELELLEATGDVQIPALERGEMDAGLMLHAAGMRPGGLSGLVVFSEPLVFALPSAHQLANSPVLQLEDVVDVPLVKFPQRIAPSLFDAIDAMYSELGCTPTIAQEAKQMQTIVNLVSAGLGGAWVPQSMQEFQRKGVVYRSVFGPVPHCETSVIWVHSSPVLERFLNFAPSETMYIRSDADKTLT
jgi:DNA-binding transcriptional LysR family regulator